MAVVLGGFALRLLYFFGSENILFLQVKGDDAYFDQWALSIAQGETIAPGVFYLEPLYPHLMAIAYKIVGHHPDFIKFAQHLLGAISCGLLAMIGSRVFNRRVGLLAAIMMSGYGLGQSSTGYARPLPQSEPLFLRVVGLSRRAVLVGE